MNLNALMESLRSASPYRILFDEICDKSSTVAKTQVIAEAVPFLLATLRKSLELPLLVVTPRAEDSQLSYESISTWIGDLVPVHRFAESDSLPFERLATNLDAVHERLETLVNLTGSEQTPPIIVTSTSAMMQKTISKKTFKRCSYYLKKGHQISPNELASRCQRMGYQFASAVYAPGTVSRRGGIFDIFPVGAAFPTRIEFWDNEIESLRQFDPSNQKSIKVTEGVEMYPAAESLPLMMKTEELEARLSEIDISNCSPLERERVMQELDSLSGGSEVEDAAIYSGFFNHGTLLDYFPKSGLIVLCQPFHIANAAKDLEQRTYELQQSKENRGELPLNFPSSSTTWNCLRKRIESFKRLEVLQWGAEDLIRRDIHILPFNAPPRFSGDLDRLVNEASRLIEKNARMMMISAYPERLEEVFSDGGLPTQKPADDANILSTVNPVHIVRSSGHDLGGGFILELERETLIVIRDAEIFGASKRRRASKRRSVRPEVFFRDLSPGDYMVHVEHGIGRFIGTGPASDDRNGPECLILQYARGDKLFIPFEQLDRVATYVAPIDQRPALTRLGTQEWSRAKARVERSTREMAAELLSLYATRELAHGYALGPDTPWQRELEDSFPYEETPDQLSTLAEVKMDQESTKPMDRLMCGDVGYGKTEIALRAAFKAVMDGKQVAVLVPTTVLAQQHYATFSERLSPYPTRIEVLSRFRKDTEQRQILDGLKNGQVDICIGTHRLIQRDVRFKDLGLVVIDEEQRFGVKHKEQLRSMRSEVDILTMTATPIPRTLHMSLAGVRDMSTIETPPDDRLPIKTYVSEFSDDLIREAILRELDRQGQVYFLHNRVHNIEYIAEYISNLVPEARVAITHGQMPASQLERAMANFSNRETDILICTTIIESGLDIPNVNTLIINRADTFGLAQLYQLRGRVGRGSRRAYAYLLIPRTHNLSPPAESRLKAMLSATDLGSGFHIAMKDLEIRGAGNILGLEQSGHIHAVGFELYTRFLSNAVEELRIQRIQGTDGDVDSYARTEADAREMIPSYVDIKLPASLPENYVLDLPTRLDIYQRLKAATSVKRIDEMETELRDRFGPLPWQTKNLLYTANLRVRAQDTGITSITRQDDRIVLQLQNEVGGGRHAINRILGENWDIGNTQVHGHIERMGPEWEMELMAAIVSLSEFQEHLKTLLS